MHEVRLRLHVAVDHRLRRIYLSHGPRRQHLHLMILRVHVFLADLVRGEVAAGHGRIEGCLRLLLVEDRRLGALR